MIKDSKEDTYRKHCFLSEFVALRHGCSSCGINPIKRGINLLKGIPASMLGIKQVDVILINIEDKQGRKHIVIGP